MRDAMLAGSLVLAFALFVTAHVTLVAGLATRAERWHALVAFFALPLAPYLGYANGMRKRAALWGLSAAAYVVLRWVAER
jgi:hypothetical protein